MLLPARRQGQHPTLQLPQSQVPGACLSRSETACGRSCGRKHPTTSAITIEIDSRHAESSHHSTHLAANLGPTVEVLAALACIAECNKSDCVYETECSCNCAESLLHLHASLD